ncbi:MAG: PAS domain S-box protein [Acidimicrobiales bacterium]
MTVLELLVGSVVDYAIYALDPDGNVVTWNPGAEKLKGYAAEEIIGRHFSAFYTQPDLDDGLPDRGLAIAAATGHFLDEGWRRRKDGSEFWASVVITALRGEDGRLVGFGKITRDLTERKHGEDALRESEERFRLLVGSVADYAIFLLDPDGRVSSWNRGAERLKGYRADEIIGRHFSSFYTEEDKRNGVPARALATALEDGRWESEGWRVRKDGSLFWANVVITALRGDDGAHRGFAKVTRDLTDRKNNEDALLGILERERDASQQLREVDRMRRELATIIAHDLRGPVSVVQHLLDLLLDQWDELGDTDKHSRVDRARSRLETLASLTDDVFDLSVIDAGSLEVNIAPIDLGAIARDVVDDAATTTDQCEVRARVDEDVVALGDRTRVGQILRNLVSNACKFSPDEEPVEVVVCRDGATAIASVHNGGPAIPAADQDRIFERFVRLPQHSGEPGSGLGLFIARSLAESQDGEITMQSDDQRGTTFTLTLPAAVGT